MRYILILSMVINCTCYGQFNEFVFPHACNSFLNSGNICWAAEAYEQFSFAGSVSADGQNVYNRLTLLALSGELAAYDLRLKFNGFSKLENGIYKDADLFAGETLTKEQINFILLDSLKTIKFHEIFYLDNYMLKCHLASAAPLTNFALSTGESLGGRKARSGVAISSANAARRRPGLPPCLLRPSPRPLCLPRPPWPPPRPARPPWPRRPDRSASRS